VNIDPNNGLTFDFAEFSNWVKSKYSESYKNTILCYTRKYHHFVTAENLREIDLLPATIKNNAIKSLIVLSKFLGNCKEFSERLKSFDIKTSRPDSLSAFLRILNASNSDVMTWYKSTNPLLRENERLFVKFLLHSGLRCSEAIHSFNLIIELSSENRLSEYYDSELNVLCHFKYPKLFIRRTKCCFITFLDPKFLSEIANSQSLSYSSIRKRLERKRIKLRFNELRDYFGTYLLNHGILEAEINLCQGRIPVDIFIRHYWSPKLKELGTRILRALETIENLESSLLS
jgi:intergrase/recombinase